MTSNWKIWKKNSFDTPRRCNPLPTVPARKFNKENHNFVLVRARAHTNLAQHTQINEHFSFVNMSNDRRNELTVMRCCIVALKCTMVHTSHFIDSSTLSQELNYLFAQLAFLVCNAMHHVQRPWSHTSSGHVHIGLLQNGGSCFNIDDFGHLKHSLLHTTFQITSTTCRCWLENKYSDWMVVKWMLS